MGSHSNGQRGWSPRTVFPTEESIHCLIGTVCTQIGGYQVNIRAGDTSTDVKYKDDIHHFFCPAIQAEIHEISEIVVCMEDLITVSDVE